jgi:hypothetical protein
MIKTLIKTMRYNKEDYNFYTYKGVGICGFYDEVVICETPDNGLGYTDSVLMNSDGVYTLHRYLTPWIKRKIEKQMINISLKHIEAEHWRMPVIQEHYKRLIEGKIGL